MEDCFFCKIAQGEASADIVEDGETLVAFRDIDPKAPTHVLLIPKEHVADVAGLDDSHSTFVSELFSAAAKIARDEGLDSYRLVTNKGPGAGQSVFHLHFHLLGGRPLTWPPG